MRTLSLAELVALRDSPDPWGGPCGWIDPGGPEVPTPAELHWMEVE
jgi:hypothetical protein